MMPEQLHPTLVKLPKELHNRISALAKRKYSPVSSEIRNAIGFYATAEEVRLLKEDAEMREHRKALAENNIEAA
jgi:predicted DNA-binding protein